MTKLPTTVDCGRTVVGPTDWLEPAYISTEQQHCVGCGATIPTGELFTSPAPSGLSLSDLTSQSGAHLTPHCQHCRPFSLLGAPDHRSRP